MQQYRNIYQLARESAGYTQEKASEMLGLSVESLRSYECDKRIPADKTVLRMIEIYDTQYLAYQHLKRAELGDYIPEISLVNLPSAILKLLNSVNCFLKRKDELIEISSDGIIDESEVVIYREILKDLDDITNAIMTLKFVK